MASDGMQDGSIPGVMADVAGGSTGGLWWTERLISQEGLWFTHHRDKRVEHAVEAL